MNKEFAKIKDVKAGDWLSTDGGFTCIKSNRMRKVYADDDGKLYIRCEDGKHHLDGQRGDRLGNVGRYVGLYLRAKGRDHQWVK